MFLIALYSTGFVGWLGYIFYTDIRSNIAHPYLSGGALVKDGLTGLGIAAALVVSLKAFF